MFRIFLIMLFIPSLLFNDIMSGFLGRIAISLQTKTSYLAMILSYTALFIFVLAAVSDFADGYIARKYDVVSNFGKVMDPLADKIMIISALLGFVQLGIVPAWMVVIIIGREFFCRDTSMVARELLGKVLVSDRPPGLTAGIVTETEAYYLVFLCLNNTLIHYNIPRGSFFIEGALAEITLLRLIPYWLMFIAASISLVSGFEYYFKNKAIFDKEL